MMILPFLTDSAPEVAIQFETWQSIAVIVTCAFAALIAHQALAVFNDGVRPFLFGFIQGETSRISMAAITFGLSAGFIFGLGAPMALATGVLNPWLIFLPVEILGILAPWKWLATIAGGAWGALCAFGLSAANTLAHGLAVDFITALQQISTPILWLFSIFPVLAVARQFGRLKGLITFVGELAIIVLSMTLWPTIFAGSLAMALGVILLLGFAIQRDREQRKTDTAAARTRTEEEHAAAVQANAESKASIDELFGPNAARLRRNLPWFMGLGALVAVLAASGIFAGGEATSFLIQDGQILESAQVDFYRVIGFIPLIATTALASGAYAMAGFTLVYPIGYLIGLFSPNPVVAVVLALIAGALVFSIEIVALSAVGRWLGRWPSIRDSSDHIRNAITESLTLAILVGSLMAALAMGGGLGIAIVGGLYLLNEALGRPVVRMAAGPAAVIIGGILLNLLNLVGLFTPVATS